MWRRAPSTGIAMSAVDADRKSTSAPDLVGRLDHQPELGELVRLGDLVALDALDGAGQASAEATSLGETDARASSCLATTELLP